jgi:hypothetical protein
LKIFRAREESGMEKIDRGSKKGTLCENTHIIIVTIIEMYSELLFSRILNI